jgi:hypothetical protein
VGGRSTSQKPFHSLQEGTTMLRNVEVGSAIALFIASAAIGGDAVKKEQEQLQGD